MNEKVSELQKALDQLKFWWKTEKLTVCDVECKETWVVETLDPQNFNSFYDALDEFCVLFSVFLKDNAVLDRKQVEKIVSSMHSSSFSHDLEGRNMAEWAIKIWENMLRKLLGGKELST